MSSRTTPLTDELHRYLLANSLRESDTARALRKYTLTLPEHNMQIAPEQGQFMQMLARLMGATSYIDVGVFTGYSALVMAEVLGENARILACDESDTWTRIARDYWQQAGVDGRIELALAPALETLRHRLNQGEADQWDIAFIDADKSEYTAYYEACLRLIRPGGLILVDNTLWHGQVTQEDTEDPDTLAIQRFNEYLQEDDRIDLSLVPIGDGLTLCRRR